MRLVTLGGSAAGPNPGQGCSGYLLSSGETNIVIDMGPGTLPELRKHTDYRALDAIVISHLHLDHFLDLLALRYALAYNPIPPPRPLRLWLPPSGHAFLDRLARVLAEASVADEFLSVFEISEYDPRETLDINDLTIRFHSTAHYVPCWAMRISNGVDGDLAYSADTGPAAPLASFFKGAYALIAEGTALEATGDLPSSRGHLTPTEAGWLARDARAGILVLTHVWAENDPSAALQAAQEAFSGPVILAAPGQMLQWPPELIEGRESRC